VNRYDHKRRPGAHYVGDGSCEFRVWAPFHKSVRVVFPETGRMLPLRKDPNGYWSVSAGEIVPGMRYLYELEGAGWRRPDPASRFQPEGVHGPSAVVDPSAFAWSDGGWEGIPLRDMIIYEMHVGAATAEGTFESVVSRLGYLLELGVNTLELMPVAQFPGSRNWGYDGVYPYAPQNSYGGPGGLKTLVNACHARGIAVILDVVYNHFGPEGSYLAEFGPYFTGRYRTPWGDAVNFDGPWSDYVRDYFVGNALYWVTEYHIDGLRLDAIHGIFDFSARHVLEEIAEAVHSRAGALGRKIHVIAESDLNDVRVINPVEIGGYGLDAQWNDDFHHALHTLITGESKGYYKDFGKIWHMEKGLREGFVLSGEYSQYRKRRHGNSSKDRPARQFVVFSQNHDQVGNRATGDRLSQTQALEKLKLAAAAVIFSPNIPLIFMGEEYGETAPFQYFVSHADEALIEAVRKGRREEFSSFQWRGEVPDPQAESTYLNSKINIRLHKQGKHENLYQFYKKLIRLRKEMKALSSLSKENMEVKGFEKEKVLYVRRWFEKNEVFYLYNFSEIEAEMKLVIPEGIWEKMVDSSSEQGEGVCGFSGREITSHGSEVLVRLAPLGLVLYSKVKD
jgi:maltooligosyltrehalose trehalohydrolase